MPRNVRGMCDSAFLCESGNGLNRAAKTTINRSLCFVGQASVMEIIRYFFSLAEMQSFLTFSKANKK